MQSSGKREVAASSFEFLHIEMVHYLERRHKELVKEQEEKGESIANETPHSKLDMMGFRVGQRVIERMVREKTRLVDNLDIIKHICKSVWPELFGKEIDNLRTNHRGIFVLLDSKFRWLAHTSPNNAATESKEATIYASFTCGILRGILSNLGVESTVKADIGNLPACTFTISILT